MDKAQIIDTMLATVGESGVSSTLTTHPSVQTALRLFDVVNIEFQGRGWWFNTELSLKLVPDIEGKVSLPADTLELRISHLAAQPVTEKARYVRRGGFIYDAIEHTAVIDKALTVDISTLLDVADLPPVAAVYLLRKACEEIYIDDDGDTFKTEKLERRRLEAWAALKAMELKTLAVSAMDSPAVKAMNYRLGLGFSTPNTRLIGGR